MGMIECKVGGILIFGLVVGNLLIFYNVIYVVIKVFVNIFSEFLCGELCGFGVYVMVLVLGLVCIELLDVFEVLLVEKLVLDFLWILMEYIVWVLLNVLECNKMCVVLGLMLKVMLVVS